MLWTKAERENRLKLSHSDFLLIIVSSAVSGVVSFLLNHVDFKTFHVTGSQYVDVTIYALLMAVVVAIIISVLFSLLSFISRLLNFLGLLQHYQFPTRGRL